MEQKLTLQTAAAFERIYDALKGKTDDDFHHLHTHLRELLEKSEEIQRISACMITGDC